MESEQSIHPRIKRSFETKLNILQIFVVFFTGKRPLYGSGLFI